MNKSSWSELVSCFTKGSISYFIVACYSCSMDYLLR